MNQELQEDSQNTNIDYVNELEEKVEEYKKALAQSDKTIKEQKDIVLRLERRLITLEKEVKEKLLKLRSLLLKDCCLRYFR